MVRDFDITLRSGQCRLSTLRRTLAWPAAMGAGAGAARPN